MSLNGVSKLILLTQTHLVLNKEIIKLSFLYNDGLLCSFSYNVMFPFGFSIVYLASWGVGDPPTVVFFCVICEKVVLLDAMNGPNDCHRWNLIYGLGFWVLFLCEIRPDSLPVSSDIRAACVIFPLSLRHKDASSFLCV